MKQVSIPERYMPAKGLLLQLDILTREGGEEKKGSVE